MKRILASLLFVVFAAAAFARTGGYSKVDPFILRVPVIAGIFNQVNQQTSLTSLRASQSINPAVRNLVLIGAGQSNMANSPQAAPYTPANPGSIHQVSVIDGGIYAANDPLLGTSLNNYPALGGGNPLMRIADAELSAGNFDQAYVASIAIDGTAIADWDPAQNGVVSDRLPVIFGRLASKGIVAGTNVTIVVLWGQGETDTTLGTTQAAYTAALNNVISASRTAAGSQIAWYVALQTLNGSVSAPVQAAQTGIVNHSLNIWAGPNADAITGTTCGGLVCRPDNLHFGDNGMPVYVTGWVNALHASGAPF